MSISTDIPTKNYYNFSTPTTAFLNFLYNSLKHASGNKVDMYTLFQMCNIPLIVSEKLILNSFKNKNSCCDNQEKKNNLDVNDNDNDFVCLTNEEFIYGFNTIYYGNNAEKTKLIANLCSFNNNLIFIKDVKLLLLHLHMRFLYDDENQMALKKILNNFFEGKENYIIEEFITKSLEKNFDIVHIFITFFAKFKFFNDGQIKLFENSYLSNIKSWKKLNITITTPLNNIYDFSNCMNNESLSTNIYNSSTKQKSAFCEKITEYNISKEALEYANLINKSFIEYEPFEAEDNQMRKDLEDFDNDLYNTLNSVQKNLVKNISLKPIIIQKNEIEKFTKRSFSPINNITNDNKMIKFSQVYLNFYEHSESDEYDKSINTNYLAINNTNTFKPNRSNIESIISNSYIENSKYIEIKCFKLAKTLTKFKKVKLILSDNILFYYSFDTKISEIYSNNTELKLKSMIFISQLYPSLIQNPLIPNNLYNSMNLPNKNTQVYQYQIFSNLHNKQLIYNFFFHNKEDVEILDNHIKSIQHLREISKYYNIKSNETKEIGSGHFGKVILSTHKITEQKLAIKTIHKHYKGKTNTLSKKNEDENLIENREIETFKCVQWEKDIFTFISHLNNAPNIIKCYEYFENLKYIFYVYEYCSGGNLKKLKFSKNANLINTFSKHMISGLYTLHSYGIIHRDIKNANTLIYERNDGKNILKIIDFGLSKVMGVNEYANEGYGSLPYKSPEQLLGKKYSFPVDIWALGITIYWLVYGHFPVSAETKHKMKKLIVKYEYKVNNENDKIVGNESFFYNKILTHTLINDYRKRVNILELMKYKELIY